MKKKEIEIPRNIGGYLAGNLYSVEENPKEKPIVILCHGFSGDQNEWGRFPKTAVELNKHEYNALTFDFSGSGKNPREPITLTRQIQDLEDVVTWVKNQGYLEFSTIGLSFGGLTSLYPNIERKTAIFWAPGFYINRKFRTIDKIFVKISKLFKRKPIKRESMNNEPILMDSSFMEDEFNYKTDLGLQKLKVPALIVHGSDDDQIPPQWTKEAFKNWPNDENHKYVEVPGAGHDFQKEHLDKFISETIEWLDKYHTKN